MPKPKFPPKPAAPSIHPLLGPAIERARSLNQRRLPPDKPATREEILDDMQAQLPLPEPLVQILRDHMAKRTKAR